MIDLMDLVRSIAAAAARAEENTNYPLPCTPGSPLLASVRQACVERGYTADGLAVSGGAPQTAVAKRTAYGHPVPTPRPSEALITAVDGFRKAIHDFSCCTGDGYKAMIEARSRIFVAAAAAAPAAQSVATWAANDVLAERRRQVDGEGMTNDADDSYTHAELPFAAAAYILNGRNDEAPAIWPWSKAWWKPRGNRANYVRAGALILAEIERLDRAAATEAVKS